MQIYPHYWPEVTEACWGDAVNAACILEETQGPECILYIHPGLLLTLNLLQKNRTRVPKVFCGNTYSVHSSKLPSVVYEYQEQNSTLMLAVMRRALAVISVLQCSY